MQLIFVIFVVFALLVLNELWWREQPSHSEFSRKFIHITVGSFVAFWPLMLTWTQIQFLSVAFVIAVLISKKLKIFQAIHSVQRPTWGEVFFALAVGLCAALANSTWIFTVAILQMSLADGLAAIIGVRYGLRTRYTYRVFGAPKTVHGSVTFFVVSLTILAVAMHLANPPAMIGWLACISVLAMLIENTGLHGADNLLLPLSVALLLNQL